MSAVFSILVTGSPTQTQAHLSAQRFIKAAVGCGHQISSVFFYQEAVHVANRLTIVPNDELAIGQTWQTLAKQHQFELQVCVAASNRRGVISAQEASLNQLNESNLSQGFNVLGLGQLAASFAKSTSNNHTMVQFK